jgi:predicted phosphoribosyltransferase
MIFPDRREAGVQLGRALGAYSNQSGVLVLGLPRGGVPVAFEVARALACPLDVFVVRKLGTPGREELAMGAIASSGVRVLNQDVIQHYHVRADTLAAVTRREELELLRRDQLYRGGRPPLAVAGQTVLLVDDGLATGSTMKAAVSALRQLTPARIVIAVPVAAAEACDELRAVADEIVCLTAPEPFHSVGSWYADFTQTTDSEVRDLLAAEATISPRERLN